MGIAQEFHAQTVTIRDLSTLQPIREVIITNPVTRMQTMTNILGKADIGSIGKADALSFTRQGYLDITISYDALREMNFEMTLDPSSSSLDEVIISTSRFEDEAVHLHQQVQTISAKELAFMNQPTLADIMQQSGNVLVQKSQQGGGSPVIRGFEANKVLMVVDGVRMNNAIYRGGHLQNIISVDNTILDRVETVFGPASVVYGSDALGGVMHFHTKNPNLSFEDGKAYTRGSAMLRMSTANEEKTGHAEFNIGLKKVGFLTAISYSDFGDLRQGNVRSPFNPNFGMRPYYVDNSLGIDSVVKNPNPNVQAQSGYNQVDVFEKILYQQNRKISHTLNFQYSTSSDVPRYDRLTDLNSDGTLRNAEWYYGPQDRMLVSYALGLKPDSGMFDSGRIIAGYQAIEESRHQRRTGSVGLQHRTENVMVLNLNADFEKKLKGNKVGYGVEITYNDVTSTAKLENIETGALSPLDTRYPDGGSTMNSQALYITDQLELVSEHLFLNAGLRFTNYSLDANFIDTTFFVFPFDEASQQASNVSGSVGLVLLPGRDWKISLSGATGFRAPNVDDLAKVFDPGPGQLVVPNPDLKPETTLNGELGIAKKINKKVKVEGVGYYTILQDAIATLPFTYEGSSTIEYNGDTLQVNANQNVNSGYLYGFSFNLSADVTRGFAITQSLNYTFGRYETNNIKVPLDHIPPVFGKTGFNVNLKKFRTEFFVMYNGWKKLGEYSPSGEDNLNYATAEGMPAWITLNLRSAYQFNRYLQLQLGLENILDQNYRVFASGISAPGRNFSTTLRANF